MLTALLVVAILVLLIIVHELRHFIAAKVFGLRVDEFGVGYPPRAWFIGAWGGTEYTLNWLPFGGFVRIFGDDTSGFNNDSSRFTNAPKRVQAIVLVAGVLMNALAGWFLVTGALTLGIPRPALEGEEASARLIVANVVARSPAESAGLQIGDTILALEAGSTRAKLPLTPESIAAFVEVRGGTDITVFYKRGPISSVDVNKNEQEVRKVVVRPAHAVVAGESGRVAIGVRLSLVTDEALGFGAALKEGFGRVFGMFRAVGEGLWSILAGVFNGEPVWRELVGPIGIVGAVYQATEYGMGYVFLLAAFISVNLAVINLIPIPALDGGRLAILAYEAARGRRISHLAMNIFNMVGVALVALLIITVTYQDIARLLA